MEPLIQISKINDFLYSPRSLYLHSVYESFADTVFHDAPQRRGRANHAAIDEGAYSSATRYITALNVYSEELGVVGKIDIYDTEKKLLIERKTRIKKIYDGYRMQLYAQCIAMKEMGYEINSLAIHSLEDNKRYFLSLPEANEIAELLHIINKIRSFNIAEENSNRDKHFADISIYNDLSY